MRRGYSSVKPLLSPFLSDFFAAGQPRRKAQLESSYCSATWSARAVHTSVDPYGRTCAGVSARSILRRCMRTGKAKRVSGTRTWGGTDRTCQDPRPRAWIPSVVSGGFPIYSNLSRAAHRKMTTRPALTRFRARQSRGKSVRRFSRRRRVASQPSMKTHPSARRVGRISDGGAFRKNSQGFTSFHLRLTGFAGSLEKSATRREIRRGNRGRARLT